MRLHTLLATGVGSLVLTLSASANFVELTVVEVCDNVFQVYAGFSDPGDTVLNVFNRNVTNPAGWFHDDLETFLGNDGNWRPDALSTAEDSFVTIGVLPGDPDAAAISVDPNFANGGFAFPGQTDLGSNAGWFNSNPSNNAGFAGSDLRVLIAQFSHVHADQVLPYQISLDVTYRTPGPDDETLVGSGTVKIGASDGFVELTVVEVSDRVFQVYAEFDDSRDRVLNVFNRNVTNPAGWFHDDLETFLGNAGNWRPDALSTAEDSFVTIGVLPGDPDAAAISVDPNFANGGFAFPGQTDLGSNAGWFNSNPLNNAGFAGGDLRVLIAQFSHVHVDEFEPYEISLEVTYTTSDGETLVGTDSVTINCNLFSDLNGDCDLDEDDLTALMCAWGPCADCENCPADLDGNCDVGILDFLLLLAKWGDPADDVPPPQ